MPDRPENPTPEPDDRGRRGRARCAEPMPSSRAVESVAVEPVAVERTISDVPRWRPRSRRARPAQVLVGLLLPGFAAVTQVRSNEQDDTYAGLRQSDLVQLLNGLAGSQERAENEIDRLTETRDDLPTAPASDRPRSSGPAEEATRWASWPARCRPPGRASGSRSPTRRTR